MPNYIPSMTSAYRRSLRIFVHHESVCKNIIHSLNNSICWFNTPKIVWTLLCVLREKENCSILIIWVSFQKRKKRKNLTKILFLILHCTQILEILKLIRGNHVLATHTHTGNSKKYIFLAIPNYISLCNITWCSNLIQFMIREFE